MEKVNLILNHITFVCTMKKLEVTECDRKFCIHNIEHLLNVARIMTIKNLEQNLGFDKQTIYATALLHDIGKLEQYLNGTPHALIGSDMAYNILLDCNFSPEEAKIMCHAIKTHNSSEETTPFGQLLRSSDKESRNCFICSASSECNWNKNQKNRGILI